MKKIFMILLFILTTLTSCIATSSSSSASSSFISASSTESTSTSSSSSSYNNSSSSIISNSSSSSSSSSSKLDLYFKATFLNHDGSTLYIEENILEGNIPSYKGETPYKESDATYDYKFIGWDKELCAIYEDTIYKAVFEAIAITYYTATFINYDGTILYVNEFLKEGDIPSYKGDIPTKEGTYKYKYNFVGWDKPFEEITRNEIYTAIFEEEEIYYRIFDLISFENEFPIYYGKDVFLEDVGIASVYSNNTIFVTSIHDPLDRYSIEVKSKEDIKNTFEQNDIVHVYGKVDVINGRPFINDATITWGEGGQNNCENACNIGTVKIPDREYYDEFINKMEVGNFYYSYMTFATIPTIEPNKEISFYMVFPGEDIEVSGRNIFLIEMRIPSLSNEEAEYVSSWISKFNKGDGIYANFQIYYDNYLLGLLTYDTIKSNSFNTPYTHDNVHSTYDKVDEFILETYPNYITFPNMANEYTYNYVTKIGYEKVDNSYLEYTKISFYTYKQDELIELLIDLYSKNEEYTYIGVEDGKHWISHKYSPGFDLHICLYKAKGKVVFETHLIE